MPHQTRQLIAAALAAVSLSASADQRFRLPPRVAPEVYGNVLIRRSGKVKPAVFSHWSHRTRYTCRVCHLELDFAMRTNSTEITEEANRRGLYCGACHNGKIAFGHTEENCGRCHTGTVDIDGFAKLGDLPWSKFGNGVDWSKSLAEGKIAPAWTLTGDSKPIALGTKLTLDADWNFVPPAIFPHAEHVRWLDCANCHPTIFNVKRKTTQHFSMRTILAGDFCGVCHLRVAFPIDDCQRCHPEMDRPPSPS